MRTTLDNAEPSQRLVTSNPLGTSTYEHACVSCVSVDVFASATRESRLLPNRYPTAAATENPCKNWCSGLRSVVGVDGYVRVCQGQNPCYDKVALRHRWCYPGVTQNSHHVETLS